MWFAYSLMALMCWAGSDLFSKLGCQSEDDKLSHLKMVSAVGFVMGAHAVWSIFSGTAVVTEEVMRIYLPVSLCYISSMALGYLAMRYIELSISSPICNSSGAVVVIVTIAVAGVAGVPRLALLAVALICVGVIALGFTEANEDEELRAARQEEGNRQYAKSLLALLIPVIYCLLDAAGTYLDSVVLESLDEAAANAAYELMFLLVGIACAVYVYVIREEKFNLHEESPRYVAAFFETAGQFFYIHALSDSAHVAFTVPIVSAYCVGSVVCGRVFLRERLSKKHYACILAVALGVILLGVLDL